MLTRCPACTTTFRISSEQMRARQGMVRCGRCKTVFNAMDGLVDESAPPDALTVPAEAAAAPDVESLPADLAASDPFAFNPPTDADLATDHPPTPAEDTSERPSGTEPEAQFASDASATETDSADDALEVDLPPSDAPVATERIGVPVSWSGAAPFPLIREDHDRTPAPVPRDDVSHAPADEAHDNAKPSVIFERVEAHLSWHRQPAGDASAAIPTEGSSTTTRDDLPVDEREVDTDADTDTNADASAGAATAARRIRPAIVAWSLLGVVALLGMMAQGVYLFRSDIAREWPGTRPWLTQTCARLGCKVPLGHDIDLISIDTSEMRPDPEHKSGLLLNVTLRNRAGFVQDYPNLELTLTDAQDAALLRRVFEPQEFLPREMDKSKGFAAGAELPVTLRLDVGDTPATGYRVFVFYP